jgi:hypothetical protein
MVNGGTEGGARDRILNDQLAADWFQSNFKGCQMTICPF